MYKTDIVLADCVITGEVGAKGVCTQTETQIHTHSYMLQVGLRSNTMRTRDGKKKCALFHPGEPGEASPVSL